MGRAMLTNPWRQAVAWLGAQAKRPLPAITALILTALAVRGLLTLLGANHAYSIFYPVVLLTSYAFGARRAAGAAAVAGGLGLVFFADAFPRLDAALVGLVLFACNCTAIIAVVSALTRTLGELKSAQGRAEDLANTHADMFREVNARITHHLRLVAGVLALQARGEPEAEIAAGLRKAAERSLQIARGHAELAGERELAHFPAVCERIVAALLASLGEPADRVRVEAIEDFTLSQEAATSLAAALLECLTRLLGLRPRGAIEVRLTRREGLVAAEVASGDPEVAEPLRSLADGYLLRAVVEQLGANLVLRTGGRRTALELGFEHPGPSSAPALLRETLH